MTTRLTTTLVDAGQLLSDPESDKPLFFISFKTGLDRWRLARVTRVGLDHNLKPWRSLVTIKTYLTIEAAQFGALALFADDIERTARRVRDDVIALEQRIAVEVRAAADLRS